MARLTKAERSKIWRDRQKLTEEGRESMKTLEKLRYARKKSRAKSKILSPAEKEAQRLKWRENKRKGRLNQKEKQQHGHCVDTGTEEMEIGREESHEVQDGSLLELCSVEWDDSENVQHFRSLDTPDSPSRALDTDTINGITSNEPDRQPALPQSFEADLVSTHHEEIHPANNTKTYPELQRESNDQQLNSFQTLDSLSRLDSQLSSETIKLPQSGLAPKPSAPVTIPAILMKRKCVEMAGHEFPEQNKRLNDVSSTQDDYPHYSGVDENQVPDAEDMIFEPRHHQLNHPAKNRKIYPLRERRQNIHVYEFLKTGGKRPKRKNNASTSLAIDSELCDETTEPVRSVTTESIPAILTPELQPGTSILSSATRKYSDAEVEELVNENKKLKIDVKSLRTDLNRYKQKYYRLKRRQNYLQNDNQPLSPQAQVQKLVNGRDIPKNIRARLLDHTILEQQLKENYESYSSNKDKDVFGRILAGKIIDKYRKNSYIKKLGPKRGTSVNLKQANTLQYRTYSHKPKIPSLQDDVKLFLERDCNSRMTAGKNETITREKEKRQRRYLLKTMVELHEDFQKTVPYSIHYATFCKLRPFWILDPELDRRDTCACNKHENMALLLQKLHLEKMIDEKSSKNLLQQITCNVKEKECMMGLCLKCKAKSPSLNQFNPEESTFYFRWKNVTETFTEIKKDADGNNIMVQKEAKRCIKAKIECNKQGLIDQLIQDLPGYKQHVFIAEHQQSVLEGKRENLNTKEIYIWVDFAENYCIKYGQEVQSVHFGASRKQFTLHTAMGYWHNGRESFCSLSENRKHGPPEIMAHLMPLVTRMIEKIKHCEAIHFQSDSPTTQYRNQEMFALLAQVFPVKFPLIKSLTWNNTEAGHGKGPVDGVGAAVKNKADEKVAHGQDVDTFTKFVEVAMNIENVITRVVTEESIQEMRNIEVQAKQFKGTTKVHQLTWSRERSSTLFFNDVSCFDCQPGTKCKHHALGTLDYNAENLQEGTALNNPPQENINIAEDSVPIDPSQQNVNIAEVDLPVQEQNLEITKNDWVQITLSGHPYPGIIHRVQRETATVKVMMKVGDLFSWPPKTDLRKQNIQLLKKVLEAPKEVGPNSFTFNS